MSDAADEAHEVGSLADEASKLFVAFSGWARENVAGTEDGLSGLAAQAACSARDLNDRVAKETAGCTVCPVCRIVQAVRELSPEVKEHLTSAGVSLVQAAMALMVTPVLQDEKPVSDAERIDLDEG